MTPDAIQSLRDALRLSPDNGPLRQALADMLMAVGRAEDAEKEYRAALSREPHNVRLKTGLAHAFEQQGKRSEAIVVIEDLVKSPDVPARALVLYAKILHHDGQADRATRQYRRALEIDPSVSDPSLAHLIDNHTRDNTPADTNNTDDAFPAFKQAARDGAAPGSPHVEIERPDIAFKDVGGLEALKDEIRMKIIHPLTHADLYKAYGKKIGGGILLYGPPGCGKTFLARATAGEINANFISVGINDVLDMWIGSSEKNLHEVFDRARRGKPCVLFFDEVDALAASRTDMRTHGGRHLINQFLSELDGIQSDNDGVLILAATNAPWHVDPAFRRPGRFDRILFVPPPDAPARAAVLRVMLKGKPVDPIDHDTVAKKTDGFSGADLKAVVDLTIEAKLRDAMIAGIPKPITTRDLTTAAAMVKPSTKEWFNTARNYALYANQGGTYDEILKYMKM